MSLKVGDICIGCPGFVEGGMVVVDLFESEGKAGCTVISLSRKRLDRAFAEELLKIGELSPEMDVDRLMAALMARPPVPEATSAEFLEGKRRAEKEAAYEKNEFRAQWQRLAEARPGELLPICTRRGTHEVVTFHHVLARGQKYVFVAANRKGKIYRYPVQALVVQPSPECRPAVQ